MRLAQVCLILACVCSISATNLPMIDEVFDQQAELVKIAYKDAMKSILVFQHSNVVDYRPLIVDKNRREIIVGARDTVFRLDAQDLSLVEIFDWPASAIDVEMCQMKGQKESHCRNFVRLLAMRDDMLLICGTNAFRPSCTWRRISELRSKLQEDFDGVGYAPYNPTYNNTYAMTQDGQLFTGVVTDFAGHDPTLLRLIPANRILRTTKSNNRWLNDPSFVSAFENGPFVYVFFRELAVEASNCGKFAYSRVARVCKNDVGGDVILQDQWTTFSKARLNCSGGGQSFGFDQLQSVHFAARQNIVFATFTTSDGMVPGSAICAYNATNFQKVFSGPFRHQSHQNSFWMSETNKDPNFACEVQGVSASRPGLTRRSLVEAQRYQLMNEVVQPNSGLPLNRAMFEKYKFIAVDVVTTKQNGEMFVIFVVTAEGLLKKFTAASSASTVSCLIEVVQIAPFDESTEVTAMELYKEMGALFITTTKQIFKVPLQRCARLSTKQRCLDAKDPYCGWEDRTQQCTGVTNGFNHSWLQLLDGCPTNNVVVDGQFGEWSAWTSCPQFDSIGDSCSCRTRTCDKPRPRLGGKQCSGPKVQVVNCTQHGAWTSWTDWSSCSATCGSSVRARKRYCSSPPPAHGGRICLGLDTQQEFCQTFDCPVPTPAPIHGGWSEWSDFDACSKECNGGFQKRSRSCNNPTPRFDGKHCYGSPFEYKSCNEDSCSETRRWSEWTPWLQSNSTKSGGVLLKRFRFACQARVDDSSQVSMSSAKSEEKLCAKNGDNCENSQLFVTVDGGWSDWSAWTSCSALCGNGSQWRSRVCNNPTASGNGLPCSGYGKETRQCNAHSCEGSWSCWSEYSDCSVTCGSGYRHRQRHCTQFPGMSPCVGERAETTICDAGPCGHDGYGEWSGWSSCNKLGVHVRIRPCISVSFCKGVPDAQMTQCHRISDKSNDLGDVYQSASMNQAAPSSPLLLVSCVIGAFLGGIVLTFVTLCYAIRRRSNCLGFALKKPPPPLPPPFIAHPPTPTTAKSSNIYTPPPSLRNIHPAPNVTMNPLNSFMENDYEGLSELETTLTLKRNMRTSLNNRDYS